MSKEEAREVLFKNVELEAKDDLVARMNKAERENDEAVDEKARELIASSMQRIVSSYYSGNFYHNVDLPNDEMKGRHRPRRRNIKVSSNWPRGNHC